MFVSSFPCDYEKCDSSEINSSDWGTYKATTYGWSSTDPPKTSDDYYHKQSVEKVVYGAPLTGIKSSNGLLIGYGV